MSVIVTQKRLGQNHFVVVTALYASIMAFVLPIGGVLILINYYIWSDHQLSLGFLYINLKYGIRACKIEVL